MKTLLFALISVSGLMATDPEFRVEKFPAEQSTLLKQSAESIGQLTTSMLVLQVQMAALIKSRDELVKAIKSGAGGEFQGSCGWPTVTLNSNTNYVAPAPVAYQTIEIRGEYLLITKGTKSCDGLISTYTGTSSTLEGIPIEKNMRWSDGKDIPSVYPPPGVTSSRKEWGTAK